MGVLNTARKFGFNTALSQMTSQNTATLQSAGSKFNVIPKPLLCMSRLEEITRR